jgi:hypothetical protein
VLVPDRLGSVLDSSDEDRGFDLRSCKRHNLYNIGAYSFSTRQIA